MGEVNVKVSPDYLHEQANKFRSEADNMGLVIDSLDGLMDSLQTMWEGVSANKYVEQYKSNKSHLTDIYDMINTIASNLDTVANKMSEIDLDMSSKVNANNFM